MIDTHCHLTFPDFEGRVEGVLADAAGAGVGGVITIATTTGEIGRVLGLAERFERVWAAAGVHPLYADRGEPDWGVLREAVAHRRCVAWGEMGLDNHYKEPSKGVQRAVLDRQLEMVAGAGEDAGGGKPVVLHCREAFDDLIPVLEGSGIAPERFVFHCFTGGEEEMRRVLEFGAHVSFTGVVTYPNAPEVRAAAAMAPLDRFMVETDAPFLTPSPHRGVRPNEPKYVVHVAEALAELHGLGVEDMGRILDGNVERVYGVSVGVR